MKHRYNLISQLNITPFVDVILVLLIIFMLAVSFKLLTIPINLPYGHTSSSFNIKKKPFIITITKTGLIFFDKQHITMLRLSNFLHVKKNSLIFIYADSSVRYGKVMKVMYILNKNGFHNISLVVRDDRNEL